MPSRALAAHPHKQRDRVPRQGKRHHRIANRPIGTDSQWDDSSHQRRRIHKSSHRKRCGPHSCHYRWPGWIERCKRCGITRPMSKKGAPPTTPRWKGSSSGSRSSSSMAATGRDGRSMVSWMLSMNTSIGITMRGSSYYWEEWVLCDTEDHWGLERVRFPGHQVKGERCSI